MSKVNITWRTLPLKEVELDGYGYGVDHRDGDGRQGGYLYGKGMEYEEFGDGVHHGDALGGGEGCGTWYGYSYGEGLKTYPLTIVLGILVNLILPF